MHEIERTAGEVARLLGDMRGERWTVAEGWHDWQRRLHGLARWEADGGA
jgi:hypothetical protein